MLPRLIVTVIILEGYAYNLKSYFGMSLVGI